MRGFRVIQGRPTEPPMDTTTLLTLAHPENAHLGWGLILAGFVSGAAVGLCFHREDFWGGYGSFRRRIVRLGHIAFVALGFLNLVYALFPYPAAGTTAGLVAGWGLAVGGVAMPTVCLLSGWRSGFRHLFFIPVLSLVSAVTALLFGGVS